MVIACTSKNKNRWRNQFIKCHSSFGWIIELLVLKCARIYLFYAYHIWAYSVGFLNCFSSIKIPLSLFDIWYRSNRIYIYLKCDIRKLAVFIWWISIEMRKKNLSITIFLFLFSFHFVCHWFTEKACAGVFNVNIPHFIRKSHNHLNQPDFLVLCG